MPRLIAVTGIVLTVALATPAASAQRVEAAASPFLAGTRVRVTITGNERVTGSVVAQRQDSLELVTDAGSRTRTVALAEIERAEVSRGVRTHRRRAAGIGAFVGVVLGGIIGDATYDEPPLQCEPGHFCSRSGNLNRSVETLRYAAVGGAIGSGIGLVLGWGGKEDWATVRTGGGEGAGRVIVAPARGGGVAVGASLRF